MPNTQLYLKHDVQWFVLALVIFIAAPCALLVFLAYQSVRSMGESVVRQHRETCRLELREVGNVVHERLDSLLKSSSEGLKSLTPAQPAFWDEAIAHLSSDGIFRTPLILDSDGNLVVPPPSVELLQGQPRLSDMHPARSALIAARQAHWVEADYSRAIALYQQVLHSQYVPPPVRAAVWAEMAQSEQQRGNLMAALDDYQHMLGESEGDQIPMNVNPPPLFAMLRAAEVSQQSGLPDQVQRWTCMLLDTCEGHWLNLDSEQLSLVTGRLTALFPEVTPTEIGHRLSRLEQLDRLRSAMTAFTRDHGVGPFHLRLLDTHPNPEHLASLWRSPEQPPALDQSYMLVYMGAPLTDGHWLAFDIDLTELRRKVLEPALAELMQTRGGRAELIRTPSHIPPEIVDADSLDPINFQLPAPLEFWTVRYNIESSPTLHALAASQSRFQLALLILAVTFVTVGLVVTFFQINRSVRLAQLQADVIDRVGHEFKTPIAAMAVLTSTLTRDGDADPTTQEQVAKLLYDETQSLVRLSDRLLGYAHLRSGAPRLHLAEHQLDNIVAEVVRLFPVEAGVESSCLTLEIEPADYHGLFDRAAIEEIGRNILDNAVKYCEGPPHVRIRLRRVNNECVFEVSDNGWGMDERTQRQIFKPYFRANTRLDAKVPGIGLGLTIVRSLVRAHGGTITVHSALTHGSTFEVRLPLDTSCVNHK